MVVIEREKDIEIEIQISRDREIEKKKTLYSGRSFWINDNFVTSSFKRECVRETERQTDRERQRWRKRQKQKHTCLKPGPPGRHDRT